MIIKTIIKDYISKNTSNVILYILVCSLENIVKVLITSRIYSSFLKKDADIINSVKNVAYVWVLKFILSYLKSYLESVIIPDITFYMRDRIFSDYLKINEVQFNDVDVSTDVRQIIDLTKLIRDLFIWTTDSVIPVSILMICMNGYFLLNYPTIGAINITGNVASLGVIYSNYKKILETSIEREELFLKLVEKIDEKMNNMMNIFLNNKTDDAINSSSEIERKYLKHYRQQYRDLEWFSTSVKLSNYIFSGLCLYVLYKSTKTKEDFVNGLLIYTFYIQTFETIIEEIPRYMVMISNIKHIEHYLQRKIYDRLNKSINYTNSIDNFKGDIVFNNVSFKYDKVDTSYNNKSGDDKDDTKLDDSFDKDIKKDSKDFNVINNLNLTIKAKDRIAMYAKSGSGKSTLMKLLLGFYKPQSGSILLDDVEIGTVNPSLIRDKINYINQRTLLFQDTIINNMKYGNNKTDKEIIDFLSKYDLLTIFRDCDKNKDTCLNNIIEGNGLNMSMGMQKIIFLVRGILKDSTVYIFDEPLTSLDPKTREKIINMIDKETKDKTLIIITHDKEINNIVNREVNLLEIQGKKSE